MITRPDIHGFIVLAVASSLAATTSSAATQDSIGTAFGVTLGSDIADLPRGFTEIQSHAGADHRTYQASDADKVFDAVQVTASALSRKVIRITAFRTFQSFSQCAASYDIHRAAIAKAGAGLVSVPFFRKELPGDVVSEGLATALGSGTFADQLPSGRWVRIICQAEGGDAVLSVDYNVGPNELPRR